MSQEINLEKRLLFCSSHDPNREQPQYEDTLTGYRYCGLEYPQAEGHLRAELILIKKGIEIKPSEVPSFTQRFQLFNWHHNTPTPNRFYRDKLTGNYVSEEDARRLFLGKTASKTFSLLFIENEH